ncbi:MAG: chemotaxis response regulator protein-glutamate methylesterase [Fibrobacterales bacterium]
MGQNKVKVLIVDDSSVVRQTLTEVLSSDPNIEVVGSAADPYYAAEKMKTIVPDVITLDIEMPRMDGLTFLSKLMSQHPIPVVICSSLAEENCESTFRALEYGAVDIITKPKVGTKLFLQESSIQICDSVKAAAGVAVKARPKKKHPEKKLTADAVLPPAKTNAMVKTTERVIVVGASTGGTEALKVFLEALPHNSPGIVIVQHMPEKFTRTFANRLNETCNVQVKEAQNNDTVIPGQVLIAPGGFHTLIKRSGARYYVEVKEGPLVSRHRPSVDVLFRSASRYVGKNAIAAIMTGMGDDGAKGLLELKECGAHTIAQDEASCVVFGMPMQAIKLDAVNIILPLDKIAGEVIKQASK